MNVVGGAHLFSFLSVDIYRSDLSEVSLLGAMHFQLLFIVAPLLLGQALANPRQRDSSPHRLQPRAHDDFQTGQRELGAKVRQLQESMLQGMQDLHQRIEGLASTKGGNPSSANELQAAQRELRAHVHQLQDSMHQGMQDLHQRLDGLASASDRPSTSEAEPPINRSYLEHEQHELEVVLYHHPTIWYCAISWLGARAAIVWEPEALVKVLDWIQAVDECDPDKRFPQLRPKLATPEKSIPLPVKMPPRSSERNANMFSSFAHLPARLNTAAQRSVKTLANPRLGAKLWQTGKSLEREEVQAVRLGA
ncbi:MAG: hypothetical protein M1826_000896 [Phylliscum demangeonii]|nr:MAG: hypothetical protein M1826_000896 [Phylliscum demangeonii]